MEELARKLEIPFSMDLAPEHSGTDAYAMQVAREGIPTMLLSIPLRYMHTPVELIAIKDVQRVGRLLAEFIAGLEPDFVVEDQVGGRRCRRIGGPRGTEPGVAAPPVRGSWHAGRRG